MGPVRCEQKTASKTAAGVVREAAKVLRLQVPYCPKNIPSSFGRRPCIVLRYLLLLELPHAHTIMDLSLLASIGAVVSYNTCFW